MHDYQLTPAEIAYLQERLRRDSAELDAIFNADTAEEQMLVKAKTIVVNGKNYVPAKEAADIVGSGVSDIGSQLSKWVREKLIFAFNYAGIDYFPLYALDPQHKFEPYPAMAEIIAIFGKEKSGWGCAFWFDGVNGFLSGKAPKDLIATAPELAIKAALLEMQPVTHG